MRYNQFLKEPVSVALRSIPFLSLKTLLWDYKPLKSAFQERFRRRFGVEIRHLPPICHPSPFCRSNAPALSIVNPHFVYQKKKCTKIFSVFRWIFYPQCGHFPNLFCATHFSFVSEKPASPISTFKIAFPSLKIHLSITKEPTGGIFQPGWPVYQQIFKQLIELIPDLTNHL